MARGARPRRKQRRPAARGHRGDGSPAALPTLRSGVRLCGASWHRSAHAASLMALLSPLSADPRCHFRLGAQGHLPPNSHPAARGHAHPRLPRHATRLSDAASAVNELCQPAAVRHSPRHARLGVVEDCRAVAHFAGQRAPSFAKTMQRRLQGLLRKPRAPPVPVPQLRTEAVEGHPPTSSGSSCVPYWHNALGASARRRHCSAR